MKKKAMTHPVTALNNNIITKIFYIYAYFRSKKSNNHTIRSRIREFENFLLP